jgi:hypothetical protein
MSDRVWNINIPIATLRTHIPGDNNIALVARLPRPPAHPLLSTAQLRMRSWSTFTSPVHI